MYKNRAENGSNKIGGKRVRDFRTRLPERTSQRKLADMLQMAGLDIDKNAIQKIESGKRFVTDVELRALAKVLGVSYQELLGE